MTLRGKRWRYGSRSLTAHHPTGLKLPESEWVFSLILDQTCPKLAECTEVETWIVQFETQRVLPVDPCAHLIGRLPVRQIFQKLENGDQGESPGCESVLAACGKELGKVVVGIGAPNSSRSRIMILLLRKAARAIRAVSSGTSPMG